jgi:threonine/homoserine/homoserine lactone efflux protein
MQLHTWLIFLAASIGLSLSPGPNGLLALTHGALHGGRKTLFTIAGGAVGFVAIIALCMFGIGALGAGRAACGGLVIPAKAGMTPLLYGAARCSR